MPTAGRSISMLVASLVLSACASTGPTMTAELSSERTPTEQAQSQDPTSGPAATVSPAPPTLSSAELVIRAISCNDVCGPNPGTTVLSDGRVIWRSDDAPGDALSERALTPAGLQAVEDEIHATGLLEASGSYRPTARPGKDPPGHGVISHLLRAARDGGPVTVDTIDPGTFEADNELLGDVWDIPKEAYALSDLATKLWDIEAWLPADAWADARRLHEAETYLLIVTTERSGELPPYPDVDAVRWPLPSSIDAIGGRYVAQGAVVENGRCLPITRELAAALAAAERAVGNERSIAAPDTDFSYSWARGPGSINVRVRQLLPDQPVTCLDGGAW